MDPGYGVIDETSGNSGFHNPTSKSEYSWPPQAGASSYEVARSTIADFDFVGGPVVVKGLEAEVNEATSKRRSYHLDVSDATDRQILDVDTNRTEY